LAALIGARSDQTLVSWLDTHADAMVGAVSQIGAPVEMPASVPLGPEHQEDTRSFLELVVPEDSRAVTDAFVAALTRGVGVAKVHMSSDPDNSFLLHYLDLREEHGIILRLVTPGDTVGDQYSEPIRADELASTRPRLGIMIKSETAAIISVDQAITLMLGWTAEDLVGHSTLDFVHPDDHVRAIDNWMSRLTREHGHSVQSTRLRYLCKDGTWLWLETSNDFQLREDGTTVVVAQLLDVSDEMAAVEALRYNEQFLRRLTDTVPVGLFHIAGNNNVLFVNPVLQDLIGDVSIQSLSDLTTAMAAAGPILDAAIAGVMTDGRDTDLDLSLNTDNEGLRSVRVTLRAVVGEERVLGVLGCVVDVTDLRKLADTDVLTGLRNRRAIVSDLEEDLILHAGNVSVIYADLDGFKLVNDRYGHQVGDQLLADVAGRLSSALRPGDRVGRLGGDEFLVVCPGVATPKAVLEVARRLDKVLKPAFCLSDISVRVVASLGIACGTPGVTADELISCSDSEMYEVKQARGSAPPELLVSRSASQ
jgi:diguanylate cyclase (GGDEF)-like protein/PAS domain S-box-containing protein